MVLLLLGAALALIGLLGLFHAIHIGLAISVVLLVVGVAVMLLSRTGWRVP